MPSLILTGHPCAGKTRLAQLIQERALATQKDRIHHVVIVNEASACPDHRTAADCYASTLAEKKTRAALKASFDRLVAGSDASTLIILDSTNYIKGFRYELHCISKAAGQLHGVVWVLNDAETVREWNEASQRYPPALLQELMQRYEPPNPKHRWDAPLFPIHVKGGTPTTSDNNYNNDNANDAVQATAEATLGQSVYNMHNLRQTIETTDVMELASIAPTKAATSRVQRGSYPPPFAPPTKDERILSDIPFEIRVETSSPIMFDDAADMDIAAPLVRSTRPSLFNRAGFRPAQPPVDLNPLPVAADDDKAAKVETAGGMSHELATLSMVDQSHMMPQATLSSLVQVVDDMLAAFLSCKPLEAGMSTRSNVASDANVLHNFDSLTHKLVHAVLAAQTNATASPSPGERRPDNNQTSWTLLIPYNNSNSSNSSTKQALMLPLELDRRTTAAELAQIRVQYLHWIAVHPPHDTTDRGMAQAFLAYVQAHVENSRK